MQPEEGTECFVAHCISTARGVEAGSVQDGFLFWTDSAHDKVTKLEVEATLLNDQDEAATTQGLLPAYLVYIDKH